MPNFTSQKELDTFAQDYKITSAHKAVLIDPVRHIIKGEYDERGKLKLTEPTTSEVPADQVQHWLDKGFRWPEKPPPPEPVPEPAKGGIKLPHKCSCGKSYRYPWTLKGHQTREGHG